MMLSTGLPGIRRGSRKLSSRATNSAIRYQTALRPRYFAKSIPTPMFEGRSAGCLLQLEHPLDPGVAPHRRSVRIVLGREVRPGRGVELVELQRPVHQRDDRYLLPVDLLDLGVGGLAFLVRAGLGRIIQQAGDLRIGEPGVVGEGRLADRRPGAVVQHVAEPAPRAGRADAGL